MGEEGCSRWGRGADGADGDEEADGGEDADHGRGRARQTAPSAPRGVADGGEDKGAAASPIAGARRLNLSYGPLAMADSRGERDGDRGVTGERS